MCVCQTVGHCVLLSPDINLTPLLFKQKATHICCVYVREGERGLYVLFTDLVRSSVALAVCARTGVGGYVCVSVE